MRDLINIVSLYEALAPTTDELESMKAVIAGKIKQLPADAETAKTLKEIEDLLNHLHQGGRAGIVNKELNRIGDPTVVAAQKMLSRYILSLDMSAEQRDQLFTMWREDKLVKIGKLLEKGRKTLGDVIQGYNDNPAIKELVDDLMKISALGQGKGEFAFSVLSKKIQKPQKGDLIIDGTKVEVKTNEGGAGRFTDQEVRPGAGYEQAARELQSFANEQVAQLGTSPISKTGLNLKYACELATRMAEKEKTKFVELCERVINLIFDNTDKSAVNKIADAIRTGNFRVALQEYSKLSFNYYMDKKDDDGVLYIDLTSSPVNLIWFSEAEDLTSAGLRLHADTIYITNTSDPRMPYPQMKIVDTKGALVTGDRSADSPESAAGRTAALQQKISDINRPQRGIRPASTTDFSKSSPEISEPREKR